MHLKPPISRYSMVEAPKYKITFAHEAQKSLIPGKGQLTSPPISRYSMLQRQPGRVNTPHAPNIMILHGLSSKIPNNLRARGPKVPYPRLSPLDMAPNISIFHATAQLAIYQIASQAGQMHLKPQYNDTPCSKLQNTK